MHTNPVLLSFCSLLYYKNLRKHISAYKLERKKVEKTVNLNDEFQFRIKKFTGRIDQITETTEEATSSFPEYSSNNKTYRKRVVNKWHVMLMLQMNKSLIKYRKHNLIKKKTIEKMSFIQKFRSFC